MAQNPWLIPVGSAQEKQYYQPQAITIQEPTIQDSPSLTGEVGKYAAEQVMDLDTFKGAENKFWSGVDESFSKAGDAIKGVFGSAPQAAPVGLEAFGGAGPLVMDVVPAGVDAAALEAFGGIGPVAGQTASGVTAQTAGLANAVAPAAGGAKGAGMLGPMAIPLLVGGALYAASR